MTAFHQQTRQRKETGQSMPQVQPYSQTREDLSLSTPQLNEQGQFIHRDNPHQQFAFPVVPPYNPSGVVTWRYLSGAPFRVDEECHNVHGSGHAVYSKPTLTLPSNCLPADLQFLSPHKSRHFTQQKKDEHRPGSTPSVDAKRDHAHELHADQNVSDISAIDRLKHPSLESGSPQFNIQPKIYGGSLTSKNECRPLPPSSTSDSEDKMPTPPLNREFALETRQRRAMSLKISRPRRRLAAVMATRARSAHSTVHRLVNGPKDPEREKLQRRVNNRNSVERCRNKKKEVLSSLIRERQELERENAMMRDLLKNIEATGLICATVHLSQKCHRHLSQP